MNDAERVAVAPDPACGHRALIGQNCQRCVLDVELDGASRQWNRIVDWPADGVQLTVADLSRMASGLLLYRLRSGAIVFRRPGSVIAEVVEPPDWDRGYRVVGEDGRYPTWWPTVERAKQAAVVRQRLRTLPRHGRHWMARTTRGTPYGRVTVNGQFFDRFGYAVGTNGRTIMAAHRASFIVFYGRTPIRGTVDHLCRRKRCANPDCLADATSAENEAREIPGALYGVVRRQRRGRGRQRVGEDELAALRHQFRPEWASARRW